MFLKNRLCSLACPWHLENLDSIFQTVLIYGKIQNSEIRDFIVCFIEIMNSAVTVYGIAVTNLLSTLI